MILTIFILAISTTALNTLLATNPLTIGIIILLTALILAITFAYSISSWIAFLIFLIYIGGILVIFSYFVSIIPNQTISIIYNMAIISTSFILILAVSVLLNLSPQITISDHIHINSIYTSPNIPTLILLASLLLFTIIVVVKLTILSKGPLRPFSTYV